MTMKHIISKMKIAELIEELEKRVDPENEYMEQSVYEAREDLILLKDVGLYSGDSV